MVSVLQAVQNSAACIVTQERLRDHDSMSRALIGLHWLPVDKRIEYKLLLYSYKTLNDLAPGYLCELVVPYESCSPFKKLWETQDFKIP